MKLKSSSPIFLKKSQVEFNIEVKPHEVQYLVGPNGCGKSSFLHYLKDNRSSHFKEQIIIFMDQSAFNPLGHLSLNDYVCMIEEEVSASHIISNEDKNRLREELGVGPFFSRPLNHLSGGENQLAKIFATFLLKADFYFLDEPTNHLDVEKKRILPHFLKGRLKESGLFVVSHDLELRESLPGSIYLMKSKEDKIIIAGGES